MKKNIFKVVLLVITVCLIGAVVVSADNAEDNYIRFDNQNSRIESNGHFTFDFYFSCPSDEFTANEDTLTIQTRAMVYLPAHNQGEPFTSNDLFTVTLYRKNFFGSTEIGRYTGRADNIYGGKRFTVEKGKTYYFQLDPADSNFSKRFIGEGDITNVTIN